MIESRWGGARFSTRVQTGLGVHPAPCAMRTGSFPEVKRSGRGVDHPPPHLALRLKKEYRYTSTPALGLRGLFWVNFNFTFTLHITYVADQTLKHHSLCPSSFGIVPPSLTVAQFVIPVISCHYSVHFTELHIQLPHKLIRLPVL